MPVKHRTKFEHKCPTSYQEKLRTPGCAINDKPFEPHHRTGNRPIPVEPIPDDPFTPGFPWAPDLPDIYAPDPSNIYTGQLEQPAPGNPADHFRAPKFHTIKILNNKAVEEFKKHPKVTPEDVLTAEMSNAAYLSGNTESMQDYIENVSSMKSQGWSLDTDPRANNEYMKTFVNEKGEAAVAYRGTVTWIGPDGRANLANSMGTTHLRAVGASMGLPDMRTGKAKLIQNTNEYIRNKYQVVKYTTGHSQGGYDSSRAAKMYFKEARVINFNPAPGGSVEASRGRVWVTPNDFVSTFTKLRSLMGGVDIQHAASIEDTFINRLTGGHMQGNFAENPRDPPRGTELQEFDERGKLIGQGHEDLPASRPNAPRIPGELEKSFRNTVSNAPLSMATGAAANWLTSKLDPEGKLGEQGDLLTSAGLNIGFDTLAAKAMTGAAFSESLTTGALPTIVAYEVSDNMGKAMDNATAGWKDRNLADIVNREATGEATALSGMAANSLQVGAYRAAKKLANSDSAKALTAEDADIDLALDTTEEFTSATAELGAAEETAGEIALIPLPGAKVIGGVVAAVALLGFAFHGIFGNAHEEGELKEEQREAAQKKLEGHFHALSKKYFDKIESEKFDPNGFNVTPPSSVFTQKEIEFMKRMQPMYFKAVDKTFQAAWENEKKTAEVADKISKQMKTDLKFVLNLDENLDKADEFLLKIHAPAFLKSIQEQSEKTKTNLDLEAKKYGVNVGGYTSLQEQYYAKEISKEDYIKKFNNLAQNAGFLNAADMVKASENDQMKKEVEENEKHIADSYNEVNVAAERLGFYSTDELIYSNGVDDWTPDQSKILQAHENGMTLSMYNQFMKNVNVNVNVNVSAGFPRKLKKINENDSLEDFSHFQRQLVYAGYRPNNYHVVKHNSGVYSFEFRDTNPTRDISQMQDADRLQMLLGKRAADKIIDEQIPKGSVREYLQIYMKSAANTQPNLMNTYVPTQSFWDAYETNVNVSQPTTEINVNVSQPTTEASPIYNTPVMPKTRTVYTGMYAHNLTEAEYANLKKGVEDRGLQSPNDADVFDIIRDIKADEHANEITSDNV
tara:strand:- start:8068 stop:11298 length:3231 start_codon:yes stop_codon:yes gene_type:complete